MKVNQFFYKNK